jgi:hypothetical protein
MPLQENRLCEGLATLRTTERFLFCVTFQMFIQITFTEERLSALGTNKRLFSGMPLHVLLKQRFSRV